MTVALEMVSEGVTPLDVMRARMIHRPLSNGVVPTDDQFAAACALAPYLHPKLSASIVKDAGSSDPGSRWLGRRPEFPRHLNGLRWTNSGRVPKSRRAPKASPRPRGFA